LHEVNQESASRRIALREAEAKVQTLEGQLSKLSGDLSELKVTGAKTEAAALFNDYVKEKGIAFVDDQAASDVREAVFAGLKWDKKVTKEVIGPAVDEYIDKKKYVVQKVELPRTDGGLQSSAPAGQVLDDDFLAEVAQSLNLPLFKEKGDS
jgi:hypothetical protein